MTYSETYILSSDQVYTKLYTCILYQYDINLHNFQDIMILCNFVQVNHDLLNLFHHPVMKCSPLFKSLPFSLDLIQLNTSLSHSFIPFKKTSSNPSWKSGISALNKRTMSKQVLPPHLFREFASPLSKDTKVFTCSNHFTAISCASIFPHLLFLNSISADSDILQEKNLNYEYCLLDHHKVRNNTVRAKKQLSVILSSSLTSLQVQASHSTSLKCSFHLVK